MKTIREMTLQEIQKALGYKIKIVDEKEKKKLADIEVGKPFKVGELEFVALERFEEESAVILKEFWQQAQFDEDTNNYAESDIREKLNTDFYNQLSAIVGKDNIVEHSVDLISDDGRKDYGSCDDYISLLTCDLYRRYVSILDEYRPDDWWWLATPYSTESNGYDTLVRCVLNSGTLSRNYCRSLNGVRPFCILKSNIFVSE